MSDEEIIPEGPPEHTVHEKQPTTKKQSKWIIRLLIAAVVLTLLLILIMLPLVLQVRRNAQAARIANIALYEFCVGNNQYRTSSTANLTSQLDLLRNIVTLGEPTQAELNSVPVAERQRIEQVYTTAFQDIATARQAVITANEPRQCGTPEHPLSITDSSSVPTTVTTAPTQRGSGNIGGGK